mmetsp:Transcript_5701/g.12936  ORF Transcript_5701/g.12936 Transcript_5701/m.12936 type:complete len:97 (+) Transcript_5701:363-653(+)
MLCWWRMLQRAFQRQLPLDQGVVAEDEGVAEGVGVECEVRGVVGQEGGNRNIIWGEGEREKEWRANCSIFQNYNIFRGGGGRIQLRFYCQEPQITV